MMSQPHKENGCCEKCEWSLRPNNARLCALCICHKPTVNFLDSMIPEERKEQAKIQEGAVTTTTGDTGWERKASGDLFEFLWLRIPADDCGKARDWLIEYVRSLLATEKQRSYEEGRADVLKNIGMLHQWLNERPANSPLLTNADLEYWLTLPHEGKKTPPPEAKE